MTKRTREIKETLRLLDLQKYPLHNDIMYHVIMNSGLSVKDITNLAKTNMNFNKLIYNKEFWRNMFIDRFLIKKRNVIPTERTAFLKDLKTKTTDTEFPEEYNKSMDMLVDLKLWKQESEKLTNPFIHYVAKAYFKHLDINIIEFTLQKNDVRHTLQFFRTHYQLINRNRLSFAGRLSQGVNYAIKYRYSSGDPDYNFLDKLFGIDYEHRYSYYTGLSDIDLYVPQKDIVQILYNILTVGFKTVPGSRPLELQTCISCQMEQATLKDRITGLKFCSEKCFDEFGI
jgi:hypothetical protein